MGALAVVIELRPQLNVAPQEQLAINQPFSAPFEITNVGYLGLYIDDVIVVFPTVKEGGVTAENNSLGSNAWYNFDLDRGESKTIIPSFTSGMPTEAGMVIAIDFKFLGMRRRSFFRFRGIRMDMWEWSKQPIGNVEPELNEIVDRALVEQRQGNAHASPN